MSELLDRSSPSRPRVLSTRATRILLISALVAFLGASSAPSPLYALYREAWGFSPVVMTVIFAVYSLGLMVTLLVLGGLSDYVGRRPVILTAFALNLLAMAGFLAADSVGWLVASRLLQGFATGMMVTTGAAMLIDVAGQAGTAANASAQMLGGATGAVVSTLSVQYLPAPLHTVFVLLAVVLGIQFVIALRLPDTLAPRPGALRSLRPSLALPRHLRQAIALTAPLNMAVWALGGFVLSLGPTLMREATGIQSRLAGGLVIVAVAGGGGVSAFFARGLAGLPMVKVAVSGVVLGLLMMQASFHGLHPLLFFLGATVAGLGQGVGFAAVMRVVLPRALPHERAGVAATLSVIGYLSTSVPPILVGALMPVFGLMRVAQAYLWVLLGLCVLSWAAIRWLGEGGPTASGQT